MTNVLVRRPFEQADIAPAAAPPSSAPSERYEPAEFHLAPSDDHDPTQPPSPASSAELDQLRHQLRAAQHRVTKESDRLTGLQKARERAGAQRYGAEEALSQAERTLADARRHWRGHLVAVATGGQPFSGPSPESAEHERNLRADQLRGAEELIAAIDEEPARCQAELGEQR